MNGELDTITATLARIESRLERVETHITGASEPERGLVLKVDRLMQAESMRKGWTTAAVGAAITGAASALWAVLTRHPPASP